MYSIMMRRFNILVLAKLIIIICLSVGWVKCVGKVINCNFKPVGKAEVVYTIGIFVPIVGGIIGYMDIEDK